HDYQKAEGKASEESPPKEEVLPNIPSEDNELLEWLEAAPNVRYFVVLTWMEEDTCIEEEVESLGLREPITHHRRIKKSPLQGQQEEDLAHDTDRDDSSMSKGKARTNPTPPQ
ncbi:hypothetical protein GOP47_0021027, partial [Adiantum capillus-veneris]